MPAFRLFVLWVLLACGPSIAIAQAGAAADADVSGLWVYKTRFPVGATGELTVSRAGTRWQGAIADHHASTTADGNRIRLVFPEQAGEFRGSIDRTGTRLAGFWVRRAVTDDPRYPQGASQAYAMPLALRSTGRDEWRADVAPLDNPFTLFLNVFRDEDDVLKAAFRNPEQNSRGPAWQLYVVREGDHLHFDAGPDNPKLEATLLHRPDRIRVFWSDLNRTIELTQAASGDASSYFPRPLGGPRYVYRQPMAMGDGWRVARAGDLDVDEAKLAAAVQKVIDVDPSSKSPWLIHSMAVAYRGRLILDEYFYGHGADVPHDMRSASKTFSSVMLGAAMLDGANLTPGTRAYTLLEPMGPFANPDPRKDRITVAQLMTHTSGLACDDNDPASPGSEDTMQTNRAQPNWWKHTLDLPMAHEPGAHYAYCSANINLVGAALTQATQEWLPALFDRTLAQPLDFASYHWNIMPNGEGYLGGGAFVRTRDFLKLGQMFLDQGKWNGRRVVSRAWVADSIAPHARISPETTGLEGDAFNNSYWDTDEGYAWHLLDVRSGKRTFPAYFANGNGGQLLIVVPQFDLAVMFTAGSYRTGLWNIERDRIVGDMILPAIPGYE